MVEREIAVLGAFEVTVLGYANAYASYLTTPEEYEAQSYEGGATLFGRGQLGAVCTHLRCIAKAMVASTEIGSEIPEISAELIALPLDEREPSAQSA